MLDREKLHNFYSDLLAKDFMPFWKKACDTDYGGVYTCFTNDGAKLLSTDKYIWSQGRFLWVMARYIELVDNKLVEDVNRDFFLRTRA